MTLRTRTRREWPAASAVGDLSAKYKTAHACPGEPWWYVPVVYLALGGAIALACTPGALLAWRLLGAP